MTHKHHHKHHHAEKRVAVLQGGFDVSSDPHVVFTTILGSCVAACIRDPLARVGGMNHFLLPGDEEQGSTSHLYGIHLMELLINGLMTRGASRERLEAKLFGGARMLDGLSDIGRKNADFAHEFLRHEGIRVVGGDLGGTQGRRVQFWPVDGRARQAYVSAAAKPVPVAKPAPTPAGQITLF